MADYARLYGFRIYTAKEIKGMDMTVQPAGCFHIRKGFGVTIHAARQTGHKHVCFYSFLND